MGNEVTLSDIEQMISDAPVVDQEPAPAPTDQEPAAAEPTPEPAAGAEPAPGGEPQPGEPPPSDRRGSHQGVGFGPLKNRTSREAL